MEDKRLIEVDFPLREVSEESVREKNIRQGRISSLHIWWARRPLAASRATIFAALVPAPREKDELEKKLSFIAELSKWENSLNTRLIETARKEIRDFFEGRMPRVLDCFAGGGSIPLEALRLNCETYALELNPVAILILKAILEYPPKFRGKGTNAENFGADNSVNALLKGIEKWSDRVLDEVKKEIGRFFSPDSDGSIPIGYIWARTVKCQNPSCKAEIPLMRQFWLAKKRNIALKMIVDRKLKSINFMIAKGKELDFDPSQGTTKSATAMCPVCGSGIKSGEIKKLAKQGKMGEKPVAVILAKPKSSGKTYRVVNEKDIEALKQAERYLADKVENWKWDFSPVPQELLPTPDRKEYVDGGLFYVFAQQVLYGAKKWGDLFNSRQKLVLITFVEKVRLAYVDMIQKGYDQEYAKILVSYLALLLNGLAEKNNSLNRWVSYEENIVGCFRMQALPVAWEYVEGNPFFGPINWKRWNQFRIEALFKWTETCGTTPANVAHSSATQLPYSDNSMDAVITDPPYYDSVPYSDLSDFFYVWLKRTIGDLHPDLFSTPLTPKSAEIIEDLSLFRGMAKSDIIKSEKLTVKDAKFFEDMITQSFKEIYRVLKKDGIAMVVFAHKSTEAWETIINSLLKSGLVPTASWPIHTEKKTRFRAKECATLASSVYMSCRKRTEEKVAYFNEMKSEIEKRISQKLTQFWEQGISGADFFVSAIGPAIEVFGKYSRVEKLSGDEVSVQELLDYIRMVVSEFALARVLKRADLGGVDVESRFYLLWRWTFGNAKVYFDDAIKLSRPMGVELTQLWDGGGFVKKENEFVRVLDPKERARDPVFMKRTKFASMIDALHYAVVLWEKGERGKIKEILAETGYAGNEIFWQFAQAISEVLPNGDKEKQLLQGFLYGKEVYARETVQGKGTLLDFTEGS